jgi:hypothetical protein
MLGGFLSLFYIMLSLAYAVLQFYVMVTYGNTSFQSSTQNNCYKSSDVFQHSFSDKDNIGFNLAFLIADANYVPMPNFEKIMKFELINNFVNYDFDGEFKHTYSDIDGFPTLGYGEVKVELVPCTP